MRQNTVKKTATKAAPKNRIETPLKQTGSTIENFHQKVQDKAYELFVARGYEHGFDVEDWLLAEQIVKGS